MGGAILRVCAARFLAVDHLAIFLTLCHRLFAGLLATNNYGVQTIFHLLDDF